MKNRWPCGFPSCESSAQHDAFDTHFRCACGWVGYVHSRHVSCMEVLAKPRNFLAVRTQHKIVARQRLRRPAIAIAKSASVDEVVA